MKIDLHVHVKKLSRCARTTIPQLVEQLTSHGILGVSAFDHYYFTSQADIDEIHSFNKDITVFRGTEIHIRGPYGKKEDFVLISSKEPIFDLRHPTLIGVLDYIHNNDVLTILAHPFRRRDYVDFDFSSFRPDCVEIRSTHIKDENNIKILNLASQYGMRPITNSDAHKPNELGKFYTEIPDGITTCEELKYIIQTNRYILH